MIFDALANRARYQGLGGGLARALEFLASPNASALEPAQSNSESTRFDIEGDEIFALVQRYRTKSPRQAFWEAHRKHIDVQYVVEGAEAIGWMPLAAATVVQPYNEARDLVVLSPCNAHDANYVRIESGMFAILFPDDAHMPGLAASGIDEPVKKIVVKVRV